jgi:hypothetical protein
MVNAVLSTSIDFKRSPEKAWPNLRPDVPISQQGKTFIPIYTPKTLAFRSTAQQNFDLNASHFYLWGTTTHPCVFSYNSKLRDPSTRHFLMSVKPFATAP